MNKIEIKVEPNYMSKQSNVMHDKYVFNYHITIRNLSLEIVTLRKCHWKITDAHGDVESVSGIRVVGEQPVLYLGDDYQCNSDANLNMPWGVEGHYEFEDSYGECFTVPIPHFDLKADIIFQ